MKRATRELVRERAGYRCEYCHLPESAATAATFHIEHIIAKQHGGSDELDNMCWSCHRCNLHKGPNLSGVDQQTENVVRLFHPRNQSWKRHFQWTGPTLVGRTKTGRATVAVLDMNDPDRVELRRILMEEGEWPED